LKVTSYILIFFLFSTSALTAQLNATLVGDAQSIGNNCYVITQDLLNQAGGVWYDNAINFDNDFTINYQNNFGSNDNPGADGMALVFKGNSTAVIGGVGGGLGYEGILQSLIIEFDTYQNNIPSEGLFGDPIFDHVAIQRDGNPFHNNPSANLAGPVQASNTSINIEDGNTHEIKIEWFASTTTLNVYFDCVLRLSLNQDVKNTIFSGDDSVFFGFVGSTGGESNLHQVCFNSISFVDNLQLQDQTICQNENIQVDATIPSGVTYVWSPTSGVSNPNIANPSFSPNNTTTYEVTISDICGDTTVDDFVLTVLPNTTPTFNPVPPICEGGSLTSLPTTSLEGVIGTWSPTLNNTQTTTYTFTPTDDCAFTTTLDIVVVPLTEPIFNPIAAICEGDTIAALPTMSNNGITGTWAPALNNMVTTTYTFTPDMGQGCVDTATLQIEVLNPVTPTFDTITPICQGDSLSPLPTTSNNGITGTWSPALNNMSSTTYTFTPNIDECATVTTIEIIVNTLVLPVFDAVNPICEGDNLAPLPNISNNGISGIWSPGLNNLASTTYTFTPDVGECALSNTLEIIVETPVTPVFDAIGSFCAGDVLPALPTISNNGISGTWSPALNNMATTMYTFTPGADECATNTELTITIVPNVVAQFNAVGAICPGEVLPDLPLVSNNGISGTWSPALDNQNTTEYTFTPDSGQGCVVGNTLIIEVFQPVIPSFSLPDFICQGDADVVLPSVSNEGITGNWSAPINNQLTTTYTFTPNPNQCASIVNQEIQVLPLNILLVSVELTSAPFNNNQTVIATATGGDGVYEYQLDFGVWTTENTFSTITGCDDHIIKVRQINGCSIVGTEIFRVIDYPKYFTPNSDGFNDVWNINCLNNQVDASIYIFDRFGKLLKSMSPTGPGWDGTFNGQLMPTNDYWFRVDYFDEDGNSRTFSSHFTLKR